MVIKSLIAIPTLAVGSLFYIRKKSSSKWLNIDSHSNTITQNLNGKAILITGGNTGLGYQVALELAKRQGTIVIACRDVEKGKKALEEITKQSGNTNVDCIPLDLGNLESVDAFSSQFKAKYPKVYAVVCNAGVWIPMEKKVKTEDNFEAHFGINHLGHFALMKKLIPHLKESGMKSRVVIVSSALMIHGKIDMNKKDFVYEGREDEAKDGKKSLIPTGYSDSKLMNALTCKYLANTYPIAKNSNVSYYAVCPGWCKTDLSRSVDVSFLKKVFIAPVAFMFMRSSVQGAQNILHVTLEDDETLTSGGFYRDGKIMEKESEYAEKLVEEDLDKKLWELSERLVTDRKD